MELPHTVYLWDKHTHRVKNNMSLMSETQLTWYYAYNNCFVVCLMSNMVSLTEKQKLESEFSHHEISCDN